MFIEEGLAVWTTICCLCVLGGVFFKHYLDEKCAEIVASTVRYCDTDERLLAWRTDNPGVPIGLSLEGRRLVIEHLRAYDMFMKLHPFLREDPEYRDWLFGLLQDFGPPPPGKSKKILTVQRLADAGRFLLYL